MASEDLRTITKRAWDEAFHKGNVDALDEILAPDLVHHQPPMPDLKGLTAYKQMVAEMRKAFSDITFAFDEMIAEGDVSAARWTFQGTHTGQMPNMPPAPPTGRRVTMTGIGLVHLVNGKVKEMWQYPDMLGFMQQLGVVPPMGQPNK